LACSFLVLGTGTTQRSDLHLYHLHGIRIKLRASYVANESRTGGVEEFATVVVRPMVSPPER
jgi:hypothetical protein